MKVPIDIPDSVLRNAKSKAAKLEIPLRQFVTAALESKLLMDDKPWMKHFGALRHLHREKIRIQKLIDREFGTIES